MAIGKGRGILNVAPIHTNKRRIIYNTGKSTTRTGPGTIKSRVWVWNRTWIVGHRIRRQFCPLWPVIKRPPLTSMLHLSYSCFPVFLSSSTPSSGAATSAAVNIVRKPVRAVKVSSSSLCSSLQRSPSQSRPKRLEDVGSSSRTRESALDGPVAGIVPLLITGAALGGVCISGISRSVRGLVG